MLRPLLSVVALTVAANGAFAQGTTTAPADPPKSPSEAKPEAAPPPPVDPSSKQPKKTEPAKPAEPTKPTTTPTAETPPELPPVPGDPGVTAPTTVDGVNGDMARLKAELKSELKAEVQAELRAQLQNELEAAARDQATQKAAAQEWQEERWIEEVKPKLNFLEIDGYFRFRFDVFNRLDLGTYDPVNNRGTSGFPTPTLYRPYNDGTATSCVDGSPENFDGDACSTTAEDTQTIISANMRLRLDPTLNVSENIRIRSTIDVLDNIVLGSTPDSLNGTTLPASVFTGTQNPQQLGINSIYDAIRIRRVWAEVMTPVGELRFGRMPQHFGLGLLVNNGNGLDQDAGDSADQVVFETKIAGYSIAPAYSFASSGPFGRGGGGVGVSSNGNANFFANESGQRFNLDPRDDVHNVMLTIARRDSEADIKEALRLNNAVFNYGLFGVYRNQNFDIPSYFTPPADAVALSPTQYVQRGANAGIASLWARFQFEKFKIEAEAVGTIGQINGTSLTSTGIDASADPRLQTVVDGDVIDNPIYILQGGFALESSYAFLNDQLIVGLDGGLASGDDAFGMGNRPALNAQPKAGDLDGQQYGDCLTENDDGTCREVDNTITNFRFDSDYIVDMILWREILGSVTDALYVKPHIAYYFTPDLGLRADVVYSQTLFASSAPGQQNPLGVEIDVRAFYANEDGFYLMPQGGFLLPLGGLNHFDGTLLSNTKFKNAQFAWTFQLFAGVQF